jgi:hypothetical protein
MKPLPEVSSTRCSGCGKLSLGQRRERVRSKLHQIKKTILSIPFVIDQSTNWSLGVLVARRNEKLLALRKKAIFSTFFIQLDLIAAKSWAPIVIPRKWQLCNEYENLSKITRSA